MGVTPLEVAIAKLGERTTTEVISFGTSISQEMCMCAYDPTGPLRILAIPFFKLHVPGLLFTGNFKLVVRKRTLCAMFKRTPAQYA